MEKIKAAGIILIWKEKVLMQLRDDKPNIAYAGFWSIPGGRVEAGEEAKTGAIRELLEETGYKSENPIFFMDDISIQGEREIKRWVYYDFYDEKQEIKCFEGQKMEFKSIAELEKLKVRQDILEIIKVLMKKLEKEK